jgi:hypothetical protein
MAISMIASKRCRLLRVPALVILILSGSGCLFAAETGGSDSAFSTADCNPGTVVKRGYTRVYMAQRNGQDGSGKSMADARDGSTAESFDRILRCYAEGCSDAERRKSVAKTDNLIVCLGPGTFKTKGTYDFVVNVSHKIAEGFTLGKGWKIHGSGQDKTTVQLSAYLPIRHVPNPQNLPAGTGTGVVFSTNSDDASDIEISDLTVDANYPALKAQAGREGIKALDLQAIHLRSDRGHNWIHDVSVVNTAGEAGNLNIRWEAFPVFIYSVRANSTPRDNNGNVVERVRMSNYAGGPCTAIAIANALAEVRNNKVYGYAIGYGGWVMGPVWFHDNVAEETEYGFNIDSLANQGVRIEHNQIIHPRKYGIVIGGFGTYQGLIIKGNTIRLDQPGSIGLLFQGNVTDTVVQGNRFLWEGKSSFRQFLMGATAIKNYAGHFGGAGGNRNNRYQGNIISEKLSVLFSGPSRQDESCAAGNRDPNGQPLRELPDNHAAACSTVPPGGSAEP